MRAVDIEDFNQKIVNQIYKEIEQMIDDVDKENIDEMLILQEKLASLLLLLRKENEMNKQPLADKLFGGK